MLRLVCSVATGLACLAGVGWATYALSAGRAPPGYRVLVMPTKQSAVPGQEIRYSVNLRRTGGFAGPVRLDVAKLPRGARAALQTNGGRKAGSIPAGADGGILTVSTSRSTPRGFRWLALRMRGRGVAGSHAVGLRVIRPDQDRYRIEATPRRQTVTAGNTAALRVLVKRDRGFRGRVRFRLAGIPKGWRRSAKGDVLKAAVPADAPAGSVRVVVAAWDGSGTHAVRRYGVAVVEVAARRPFRISGDLGSALAPGVRVPLDLVFENPNPFAIRLTRLRVAVGDPTSNPACGGAANYRADQYSGPYPLTLPPGRTMLSQLERDRARWPQVSMYNLPSDQGSCKGARVPLDYAGTAVR